MSSAAITIVESPAQIESDTNEAVITKSTELPFLQGELRNLGAAAVYLKISVNATAASGVTTDGAQGQLRVPLPSGASLPWLFNYQSLAHKTAAGAAILAWVPNHNSRR